MPAKNIECQRCETEMRFIKRENLQLGKQSFWHDWNHILHGALDVDIYVCPACGKIEFFLPEDLLAETKSSEIKPRTAQIAARRCAECGKMIFNSANSCPACGAEGAELIPLVRCGACGALYDFDAPKCPYCKTKN